MIWAEPVWLSLASILTQTEDPLYSAFSSLGVPPLCYFAPGEIATAIALSVMALDSLR